MTNLAPNSSFEVDANNDGRADGWGIFGTPTTTLDNTKFHSGTVSQKVIVPAGDSWDIRYAPLFITAGVPYTLSVYGWVSALNTSAQAVVKIEWHDNSGNLVNYDFTLVTAVDSGFVRRSVTSTPGAAAVTGRMILAIEGGGTVNWDDIQLEQGSSATTYTAGPAGFTPVLNLAANTSFEWDSNADGLADGWTTLGAPTTTLDTVTFHFGIASQKVVGATGLTQSIRFTPIPITAGLPYTLSAWLYVSALSSGASVSLTIEWLNGAGAVANSDSTVVSATDSGFVRRSVTSTPASGAMTGRMVVTVSRGGTVNVDDIQLEQTPTMSAGYLEPDIDWMMRAVFTASDPAGTQNAIAWYVDKTKIRPYEASYAAIAFASAYRAFNVQKFADTAWNWCTWYRDHMETDGTMYDWDIVSGVLTKDSTRDSTDAYAGMYLMALRAANLVAPRPLTAFQTSIGNALSAIELTQQSDGLTWALPTFLAKYMLDQVETVSGCFAAKGLSTILGDNGTAIRALTDGNKMLAGIANLWDTNTPVHSAYDWFVAGDNTRTVTNWATYYPDSVQNAWPVAFQVAPRARRSGLMGQFLTSQPNWADQYITGRYDAMDAIALQVAGYTTQASVGLDLIANRSQANNREFDWNPAHAGWYVIARLNASDLLFSVPGDGMPTTFASYRQFVGIALEATQGTAVPMTNTMIMEKLTWSDKPKWLDDKGWRQWFSTLAARQIGTIVNEFSMSGSVYADVWPFILANVFGDLVGTGTTAAPTTTLSASTAVGASSITTAVSIPAASIIQIDTGAGLTEIRKTGTPSGSGPFTIPLATGERPLLYAHTSGVTVTNTTAPYTSAFAVNNAGQSAPVYAQGQPPSHTITHYQGISGSFGARQFPGACCQELSLSFNAESELVKFDSKWLSYPSVIATATVTSNPSAIQPLAPWRGALGFGGPASGGTQVKAVPNAKITFKRMCEPDFTVQGAQSPYIIQRGPLDVTAEYEIIMADETHYNYMINNTQPQFQFLINNGLSGANLIQIQVDAQQAAMTKADMDDSKANLRYKMAFDTIANTANAGGTGGGSPAKVTVTNAVPGNTYM